MDIDLLFTAVEDSAWKEVTKNGQFEPESYTEDGYIKCFEGSDADEIINKNFADVSTVLLVVIDPLRIQSPVKYSKEGDIKYIAVQGTFSVDAIIDKIKLEKNKNGRFALNVKHFD